MRRTFDLVGQWRRTLIGVVAVVAITVGLGGYAAGRATPTAANKERLLTAIKSLPSRTANRVLLGQELSAYDANTYDRFVHGLERKTGERPALVGLSLLEPGDYDARAVDHLIDHHRRGGLVTVSTHWTHPWGDHPHDKYRVRDDNAPKPDLRQLLRGAPDSTAKRKYWSQVDDLVRVLTRLDQAGAPVLFRPFHEMNGLWFWWGHDVHRDRTALVELWRDLHAHLTARLSNLLWWYSPASSWNASIRHYYPGPEYVDLVGLDLYSDDLRPYDPQHRPDADDWTELKRLQHPGGLAEFGPGGDRFPRGARTLIDRLGDTYGTGVVAHSWYSWSSGQQRSLVEHPDIDWALDRPPIITLKDVAGIYRR